MKQLRDDNAVLSNERDALKAYNDSLRKCVELEKMLAGVATYLDAAPDVNGYDTRRLVINALAIIRRKET
jgi:hypothetical protein